MLCKIISQEKCYSSCCVHPAAVVFHPCEGMSVEISVCTW